MTGVMDDDGLPVTDPFHVFLRPLSFSSDICLSKSVTPVMTGAWRPSLMWPGRCKQVYVLFLSFSPLTPKYLKCKQNTIQQPYKMQ